ncbi:hypothetical protein PFMALIP_05838 [Plasmodium falciparum MaliPS096_E11]|uniref:Duffy-binding-like domain-containing protein n=1 Tax=Plasmodium falciparum MaliPS096_E11 TaxID=1036727 RepID=A0A024WHC9_PLAFA|nr:hypothetical protein PFMALIP_05838 [Plasmodium falciparum MaliPS096_E11]
MGPKEAAPDYDKVNNAKELFDEVGKYIEKKVHSEALERSKGHLKGILSKATYSRKPIDKETPSEPCQLNHRYHTNVKNSGEKEYPCRNGTKERFPDKEGAQCHTKKIKDSNVKEGACAPYRRLHLCDHNLENISDFDNINNDTLLVDVCQAAKFEGESITRDYLKYQAQYASTYSPSQICTMLARSFADIGDIVRGRDLYLRDKGGKTKLKKNLEKIFKQLYEELTKNNKNEAIKTHYQKDTPNYYQLREDWWALNRQDVWKALTCHAGQNDKYFRDACSGGKSSTPNKCRCATNYVPTYFDYVPQYLRWFEEWAEDFCRKKEKKVENLQKQCRGQYLGADRYCSRNGYDCEQTVNARGKVRMGKGCTDCFFACYPYVEWIDKKKEEFDKQKKKYTSEMQKYTNEASLSRMRQKRAATTTNYEGYEKKFYNELKKSRYENVDAFLGLLNKEEVCTAVNDEEGGTINFKEVNSTSGGTAVGGASGGASGGGASSTSDTSGTNNEKEGTFYRSKYCQPCPHCGVKRESDKWITKPDDNKCRIKLYKPIDGAKHTPITILKSGEGEKDIAEKLNAFCDKKDGTNSDPSLYDPWKCYQFEELTQDGQDGVENEDYNNHVKTGGGLCILKNTNKKTVNDPDQIQKTFNNFFNFWVAHMLKDSIYWRTKKLVKCLKNGNTIKCGKNCNNDCGCFERWIGQKKEQEWTKIKEHFMNQPAFDKKGESSASDMFRGGMTADFALNFLLEEDKLLEIIEGTYGKSKETEHIKKLLNEGKKKNQEAGILGVPGTEQKSIIVELLKHEKKIAKDCQQKQNECEKKKQQRQEQATRARGRSDAGTDDTPRDPNHEDSSGEEDEDDAEGAGDDKVCEMVKSLIGTNDGKQPIENCNPKEYNKQAYPEWKCDKNSKLVSGKGECMPPRRQKLCLYYIAHESQTENIKTDDNLKDAFIKTAAAETFHAWHYYKSKNSDKANQLERGIIPPEFLRSMFYTYGDYRDILFNTDISAKTPDGHVKKAIDCIVKFFQSTKGKSSGGLSQEQWWKKYGEDIWKGMLCALEKISGNTSIKSNSIYKYSNVKFTSAGDAPKLTDFVTRPQFLRWFTEWAEWFCKAQSQEYKKLQDACSECMKKGKVQGCTSGDGDSVKNCKTCKAACEEYNRKIKTWENQWNSISAKYIFLYLQAKNDARYSLPIGYGDPNDQQVVDFFKELQKEIKNSDSKRPKRSTPTDPTLTSPCSSAEGYIHQELGPNVGCKEQTKFCFGGDNYAFKHPPKGYEKACDCENRENTPVLPPPPPPPAATTDPSVDVCNTVHNILTGEGKLNDACKQKYSGNNSRLGWKCIPTEKPGEATGKSGETTSGKDGATGSVCIPPRRRRLYVGKLEQWVDKVSKSQNGESSGEAAQGDGQKTPSEKLRDAFIQSAAIETFFLWHKFKEQWRLQKQAELQRQQENGGPQLPGADSDDPQNKLKSGTIPTDFLRQMFYTLGDYRDICVGNTPSGIDTNGKDTMKKIKENIEQILPKNGTPPSDKNPNEKREQFWKQHGKYIWEGMLCGLSYDTNTKNGEPLQQVKTADDKDLFDELKKKYGVYESVELENSDTQAKQTTASPTSPQPNQTPSTSGENTPLSKFVERPPYFRYLEEWGETFCRQRTRMLEKIKYECRNSDNPGKRHCSGDGHVCEKTQLKHNNMSADPNCPDCYKQCRKYRKWIDMKFQEFHEQKSKYEGEHDKLTNDKSSGDNNCCNEIEKHTSADKFLKELKHCKDNQGNSDQDNKIDFEKIPQTFSHSKYCETCPLKGVTCNRGTRGTNHCTPVNGNGETWAKVFDKMPKDAPNKTTTIDVQMIDRRGPFIKNYSQNDLKKSKDSEDLFKTSNLFKSVREQNWTCKYKGENMDLCKLNNFNKVIDLNEYTTFKVLLIYWLEDFLYGYYILKKRKIMDHCTKSGGNTCDEKYQKNCVCVKKWVDQKTKEWNPIKNYYDANFKTDGEHIYSRINSFFEQGLFDSGIKKDKGNYKSLEEFEKSVGCNCHGRSKKENDKNNDVIDCLLKKLEKKISECKSQDSGKPEANCVDPTQPDEEEPEPLEEEEYPENTLEQPNICPQVDTTEETVDEGGCEEAPTPDEPAPPSEETNQNPEEKPEAKDIEAPPSTPPYLSPPLTTALVTSTLAWSVGIAFAA